MDVVCAVCGQRNPADRPFCVACNSYLDDNSVLVEPDVEEPGVAEYDGAGAGEDDREIAVGTPVHGDTGARPGPRPARPVGTVPCPRCQTENRLTLRFCRRCGQVLADPAVGTAGILDAPEPPRRSWWDRLTSPWFFGGSSLARAAYRRSLPLPYRLLRLSFSAVVVVAVAVVGIFVWKGNPVRWVQGTFWDLTNTTVAVSPRSVTASAQPSSISLPGSLPARAADGDPNTAWLGPWSPAIERSAEKSPPPCGQVPSGAQTLVLDLSGPVRLRGIALVVGLADARVRGQFWTPKSLQVVESPGHCKLLQLADTGALQTFKLEHATTASVAITVVDAFVPPTGDVPDQIAITEVTLLRRPG